MPGLLSIAPLVLLPALAVTGQGGNASLFTDLWPAACETVALDEDEGWSTQRCPGARGYTLLVHDDDARQSITVVAPDGREHPLDFWRVVTQGFSSLGEQVEWRVPDGVPAGAPSALMVRVDADEWTPDGRHQQVSYLAVVRIDAAGACVVDRIAPAARNAWHARAVADSAASRPCLTEAPPPADAFSVTSRHCYRLETEDLTAATLLDRASDGTVRGRTEASIHDEANAYYSSYVQVFAGAPDDVAITTWIEYDVQRSTETWTFTAEALATPAGTHPAVSCDGFEVAWAEELLGIQEAPTHTRRLELTAGVTSTVSSGVVRGERDRYEFEAEGGVFLQLAIRSPEDNAVFDVIAPSGLLLVREATLEEVFLPHTGTYAVIVGGTRGNAGYELDVTPGR